MVVVLDLLMIVTSLLPLLSHQESSTRLSSFLSNYNFTRLFVEFVFESIPQTILQVKNQVLPHMGFCHGPCKCSGGSRVQEQRVTAIILLPSFSKGLELLEDVVRACCFGK